MKKQLIALTGALTISAIAFVGGNSASAATVKINSGDTLSGLALKHGTTVANLKQLNGLSSDLIYAGASLEVGNGSGQSTYQAPAQQKQQVTYKAPVQQKQQATYKAPVQQKQQTTYKAPVQQKQQAAYKAPVQQKVSNTGTSSAKAWIAHKESTNSYSARSATGKYIGKYQLDRAYLNGDHSAANQERVAEKYVKERYGSWDKAKAFHQSNGWY